jgi:precorrin-6B methylase 1
MKSPYDLYIIGLGVSIPEHLTIQAIDAMSSCSKLFSIVQEPVSLWLPPEKVGKVEVINLLDSYVDGGLRVENYERAAETVLSASGTGGSIGYITYGNAMAYDSVAQRIVKRALDSGRSAHVVPGISSLDSILCDIQVDMAPAIQVFEASWLLAFDIIPRVDTHVILVQMGSFGSYRAHYSRKLDGSALTSLIQHLSSVYPKDHRVSLVRSTASGAQPEKITRFTLERLSDATAEELSGASLYIPALTQPSPNAEALARLEAN